MAGSQSDFLRLVNVSRDLGVCFSDLRLDYGRLGRGLFRSSDKFLCRIPNTLFFPVKDIILKGSVLMFDPAVKLPWNNNLSQSGFITELICEYLNLFVLNPAEQKKWSTLWLLLNNVANMQLKALMISLAIYPFPSDDSFQMNDNHSLCLYLKSRSFYFNDQVYSAPFWDLINHSPDAYNFRRTPAFISSPVSCPVGFNSELLQRYSPTISGLGMWMTHLFVSCEYFVYSFPFAIAIPNSPSTLVISGLQNLDQLVKQDDNQSNCTLLRAFPLVSPTVDFSLQYLAQYLPQDFTSIDLNQLYKHILLHNLEKRKVLYELCSSVAHVSVTALFEVVSREIFLIQSRLHELDSLK